MHLKLLRATNPDYDADTWADYWALYSGGETWQKRAKRFLHPNPQEADDQYYQRLKAAHYRSYLGPIVDFFVSFLFTSQLVVRAQVDEKTVDVDEYYSRLKEDCDGQGTDLVDLLKTRLTRALVDGASYVLVDFPSDGGLRPASVADWRDRGLDGAKLRSIDRSAMLDWEADENGELLWAIVYECTSPRRTPLDTRDGKLHRWRVYDRQNLETYELYQEKGAFLDEEQSVQLVDSRPHGLQTVPIVRLSPPGGMWIADRVASAQKEHCILSNAHTWLIRRTCYAMPVFKIKDKSSPPKMGAGYYMMIGADEDFTWSAPDSSPFDSIRQEVASQKDEIFRTVHQMAQGVDNSAAAVGRSGESKQADAASTRVMLEALGSCVREAVGRVYSMLSAGRGEEYHWSIEGLGGYQVEDVDALLTAIGQVVLLDIPSPTFAKEIRARAALSMLPDADQAVKDVIRDEIEKNFVPESVLPQPKPGMTETEQEDEADEDGDEEQ